MPMDNLQPKKLQKRYQRLMALTLLFTGNISVPGLASFHSFYLYSIVYFLNPYFSLLTGLNLWAAAEQRRWFDSNSANSLEISANASKEGPTLLLEEPPNNFLHRILVLDTNMGIYVYSIIIGGVFLLGHLRALQFYGICTGASEKLHEKMFQAVLRAPIKFFDKNSVG